MASRDMYIEGLNVAKVVKALSSDVRLQILNLLDEREMNIQMLKERLQLTKTAVINHVHVLEEAGFISTRYVPGTVGNQKMCTKLYDRLIFNFTPQCESDERHPYYEIEIKPGNFFDFQVYPPCGLADERHIIQRWDHPDVFYDPERFKACLVWCAYGYVEYRIPMNVPFGDLGQPRMEILLEIGAQGGLVWRTENDLQYRDELVLPDCIDKSQVKDGKSDITFWLGGLEIGTVTVSEHSRYQHGGRYTPKWWRGSGYGQMLTIDVSETGTMIDGQPASDVTFQQVLDANCFDRTQMKQTEYMPSPYLSFRVGIKPDAQNISGFNIFGRGFGNYSGDIAARFY